MSQRFNISQNAGDEFRGDKIVILYDPGDFPALLRDKAGKLQPRNGGVPQLGNLTEHLNKLRAEIEQMLPDRNFNGNNPYQVTDTCVTAISIIVAVSTSGLSR